MRKNGLDGTCGVVHTVAGGNLSLEETVGGNLSSSGAEGGTALIVQSSLWVNLLAQSCVSVYHGSGSV